MTAKFRPYFSLPELDELLACLKERPSNKLRITLIKYLETTKIKAQAGLMTSQYTVKPSIEQRLGFTNEPSISETKRTAYEKWSDSTKDCTPREIELAMLYRYENDLMSPEEEAKFEEEQGKVFTRQGD